MSERRRPARPVTLAALLAVGLTACQREPNHLQETLFVFGSEATIDLVDADQANARATLARVSEQLQQLDHDWHAWRPGALTTLNEQLARGEHAPVPPSIRELIDRSRPIALRSDGMFNPAIGRLVAAWGFHTSEFPITTPPPDEQTLADWRQDVPTLFDLAFDGERAYSRNPRLQLDFDGIAEGAAAEKIGLALRAAGLQQALISLGGDVLALGQAGDRPWRVGLRDPFSDREGGRARAWATVELHDGEALFTSGDYARFRSAPGGARWAHIVDPRSGLPVHGVATVSVLHDDPWLADAAATALMVAGPAHFAELLHRMGIRCALLMTDSNELMITAAMQARLTPLRQPVPLGPPLGEAGSCSER